MAASTLSTGSSLKRRLKAIPWLVHAKRAIEGLVDSTLHPIANKAINQLPLFAPGSWGSSNARAKLTIQAANQTFPFIVNLLDTIGRNRLPAAVRSEDFCPDQASKNAALLLKNSFDKYGSDKSTSHNYHYIYGPILKNMDSISAVLEIGLGTNNASVVSNMGRSGSPGASVRAFRDFLPNANVYGADVDRRILFEESRIKTYFVDQTDLHSFGELAANIAESFDLIIDDGLHSPNANIAVLSFGLTKIKRGGWLVIEDIVPSALPVWQVIAAILPKEYETHLIADNDAIVFAVQRTGPE